MKIKLDSLKNILKETFIDFEMMYYDEVFEEDEKGYKYVIFLHKFYYNDKGNIYTKFIFYVDKDKNYLLKNNFKYLYDLNCVFRLVSFDDVTEVKSKILNTINNDDFSNNLKHLSKLIETPSTLINDWFSKNDVNDISVSSFKYAPKIIIIGCSSLSFDFEIKVDNIDINLNIKKEDEENFILYFDVFDETHTIYISNMEDLITVIGNTIKEKIK